MHVNFFINRSIKGTNHIFSLYQTLFPIIRVFITMNNYINFNYTNWLFPTNVNIQNLINVYGIFSMLL